MEGSMVTKTKKANLETWACVVGVEECRAVVHVEGEGAEERLLSVDILCQNEAVLEETRVTFYIPE